MSKTKNAHSRSTREICIDEGIAAFQIDRNDDPGLEIKVDKHDIIFVYSTDSSCGLEWPFHRKSHVLNPVKILVYSYPLSNTSFTVKSNSDTTIYLLKISIGRLHSFFGNSFGDNADEVQSFVGSFRVKNIYTTKEVTPAVSVLFHQLFNHNLTGPMVKLFYLGKVMEFLSIYTQQPKVDNKVIMECSFVNDHLEMEKIREARDLIVKDLTSPPNLKDLARLVGTNVFKLKVGFKSMFGNTVYGYLNDFRLEKARHLLEMKSYSVKEISNIIGYSNPSHFIATYKKRYGVTPKKHLMSMN